MPFKVLTKVTLSDGSLVLAQDSGGYIVAEPFNWRGRSLWSIHSKGVYRTTSHSEAENYFDRVVELGSLKMVEWLDRIN